MKLTFAFRPAAVFLALVLLSGTIPASAAGPAPDAGEPSAYTQAAGSGFTEVELSDGSADDLKSYLETDGDYIIRINRDLESEYSRTGDWCTLGSGVKVLNLNGHEVTVHNDGDHSHSLGVFRRFFGDICTMLSVPEGAELVINDDGNSGAIEYAGSLDTSYYGGRHLYFERRDLIKVNGGKLTVNGGNFHAGRSRKYYSVHDAKNVWAQINGLAVYMTGGTVVINGGSFEGRGYTNYNFDLEDTRSAAISASSGDLTIYDGEFWGKGSSDVMHIHDEANICVYGGVFDTHKLGCPIAFFQYAEGGDTVCASSSYGSIGLPARAFRDVGGRTEVYKSGAGYLTPEQVGAGETEDTSKRIEVFPAEVQPGVMYRYNGSSYQELEAGATVEWDKVTNLRLRFTHDQYYPHDLTGVYSVYGQDHGNTSGLISEKPFGLNRVAQVASRYDGSDEIDLNSLPQSDKDKLEVGHTYYLTMLDTEKWMTPSRTREITYRADANGKVLRLTIVEPDLSAADINMGLTFENSLNSAGKPQIRLIPTGDAEWANLDTWMYNGTISKYEMFFRYMDKSGSWTTPGSTGAAYTTDDFYRGVHQASLTLKLYKGDKMIAWKTVYCDVVCFPDLAADRTIDSSNRVLVDPSSAADHVVALSCGANSYTGIFWTRDGTKLSNSSGLQTYRVDVSGSSTMGWYGIGYTVGGKDYISGQLVYLGVKDSDRTVSISASSASYTLRADGDASPTLTAAASGSGWGTIREYKWQNVSWPEGTAPGGKRYTTSTNTITMAKVFGCSGNETSRFVEGTYVFSVTAYDSYGRQATSGTVSVIVYRPAQGVRLWQHVKADDWHEFGSGTETDIDVTGGFVVLKDGYTNARLIPKLTPENSTAVSYVKWSSENSDVVRAYSISDEAFYLDPGSPTRPSPGGSSTVTITTDTGLSASTRVLVPKTCYDVTIPEEWLNVEAGAEVRRGTIPGSYTDYTAELVWYADEEDHPYEKDTFEGNHVYYPALKIYPDAGVCYPVTVEYTSYGACYYPDATDRYVITVNGFKYRGADSCGRQRDYFLNSEPLSEGGKYDFVELVLTPTEKIIDQRDDCISCAVFCLDVPAAGDPKDMTPGNAITYLSYSDVTDGIALMDNVMHVTDPGTVNDAVTSNDALEDFTVYEAGETYRAEIWVMIDTGYTTPRGGKAFFADKVTVIEPELRTLSGVLQYYYVPAYVYFTVDTPEGTYEGSEIVFTYASYGTELAVTLAKPKSWYSAVLLVAAVYDADGRMLAAQTREAVFNGTSASETFSFPAASGKIASAKVYAVDAGLKPVAFACSVDPSA